MSTCKSILWKSWYTVLYRCFKMSSSWEGGSGWGTHVNPWLIRVNVWQNPLQYCKVISLQLIKINGKKINKMSSSQERSLVYLIHGITWELPLIHFYSFVANVMHEHVLLPSASCPNNTLFL